MVLDRLYPSDTDSYRKYDSNTRLKDAAHIHRQHEHRIVCQNGEEPAHVFVGR